MCERFSHRLPLTPPAVKIWPAPQARALTGNPTATFQFAGPLGPLSHTSQGQAVTFYQQNIFTAEN